MSVSTQHNEYIKMYPIWRECQDAVDGQEAIKSQKYDVRQTANRNGCITDNHEAYLPATSGMIATWYNGGADFYESYRRRARFYAVAEESLEGAIGVLFAKDPTGEIESLVTNNGLSIHALYREVARHVYTKGRHVLVVDAPEGTGDAYITQYCAESLINWGCDSDGMLSFAVFKEEVPANLDDIYSHETKTQYRIYHRGMVEVIAHDGTRTEYPLSVDVVPVVIVGAIDLNPKPDRPPVKRISECAIAAYRNSADYQQSLYLTAQPTHWQAGMDSQQYQANLQVGLGGNASLYLGENGSTGYLEFSGNGIDALKQAVEDELSKAADYAVKLLQTSGVESAQAKGIRDAAQKSALETMADTVSMGINRALEIRAQWNGRDWTEENDTWIQIERSQDKAESTMISAMSSAINQGNMPKLVLYNQMVMDGKFVGTYEQWIDGINEAV